MARRTFLTDTERQSLFDVPIAREDFARHYILSTRDLALIETRRSEANRIGFAVQLALLRHPGFGFSMEIGAPPHLVAFIGDQIGVAADAFAAYAARPATASLHAREAEAALGLRPPTRADLPSSIAEAVHLDRWRQLVREGRSSPTPLLARYPPLLDAPAPRLRAYPVTTVVAEKFQALVQLGIANSRLKDFYDLWLIAQTFEFDRASLAEAVRQTFARRETMLPTEKPIGLSDAYADAWGRQWRAFLGRERMASAPTELAAVVSDLSGFLLPLIEPVERDERWKPGEGWSASNA